MSNLPLRPVVVFKIATNVPQLILDAQAVSASISANAVTFVTPVPSVATVDANITALDTAEAAVLNETGSAADRDLALATVIGNLNDWRLYVQSIVNATPAEAAAIAARADMRLKVTTPRQKVIFHAKNDDVSGTVNLFATGGPRGSFHEWSISANNINWTALPSTVKSVTHVTGLAPASRQYFRHRITTPKDGQGNWEQPFAVIVT